MPTPSDLYPKIRPFQPQKLHRPRDFNPPAILHHADFAIDLEIGAGKGKHALTYAQTYPDRHLIAIERTQTKFAAFAKSAQAHALPNLHPIHADAIAWTLYAIPPQRLDTLFLLYPNPEPKNPNQRWHNMPFFEFLLSRLTPNGTIILATNIQSYLEEAQTRAATLWHLPHHSEQIPQTSQRTHFESKYLARGEPCWQLVLTKPKNYRTRFDQTDLSHIIHNLESPTSQ